VARGEHWFATQGIDIGLVDVIKTRDDALLEQQSERLIYKVKYKVKKGLCDKLALGLSSGVSKDGVSLLS
ncbi:protease SohB, partial [Pseudoalteromonas agarivorans]